MQETEKGEILKAISNMDEKDKNFVLGYMAGRVADKQTDDKNQDRKEKKVG